jgi:hypothetical protein
VSPYLQTVKTASGATAVQIVHSSQRGSRDIEHSGSAITTDPLPGRPRQILEMITRAG